MRNMSELKGKTFKATRVSNARYCKEDLETRKQDVHEYVAGYMEENPEVQVSLVEHDGYYRVEVDGNETGQVFMFPSDTRRSTCEVVVTKSGAYTIVKNNGEKIAGTQLKKDMMREYGFEVETLNGSSIEYHIDNI